MLDHCPSCSQTGQVVDNATLKALLDVSLRRINDAHHYRFCKTVDCDVVYFSQEDGHFFTSEELRVPVYQKAPDNPDSPVCYCFGYSLGDIQKDAMNIIEDINRGIQAGQCACDWRNPQGTCCLGNVRRIAKHRTS